MGNATLWFSIITFTIILITVGCGFSIHFGGKAFKSAVRGHAVLGAMSAIVSLVAMIIQLTSR